MANSFTLMSPRYHNSVNACVSVKTSTRVTQSCNEALAAHISYSCVTVHATADPGIERSKPGGLISRHFSYRPPGQAQDHGCSGVSHHRDEASFQELRKTTSNDAITVLQQHDDLSLRFTT